MVHFNSWTGYGITDKPQHSITKSRRLTPADFPARTEWSIAAEEYLQSRGIDLAWVSKLNNVYPVENGICFLLDGVLGYTTRAFAGPTRWLNAPGISLASAVFAVGMPNAVPSSTQPLYIVEGPTDALAVAQEGCMAVATLGAMLPRERLHTLWKFIGNRKEIIIIPDNDSAGINLAVRLSKELPDSKVCWCGYKDFASMPRNLRSTFLHERA